MSSPITLAICGAGSRGLLSYAPYALQHPEEARVVAVAEPRDWYREEAVRRHALPAASVFRDWRELAARPRLADAVIIATQDRDHTAPALALIERGYDVLLEKPMAPTEAECRAIAAAARRSGAVFALCHVLRYTPYFRLLKQLIDSGVLGEVVTVRHLEPVGYWHQAHSFVRGNWRNSTLSSPMLLAKSCHDMDILLYLLGRPCRRVSSFGTLKHFRRENRPPQAADRCLDCPLAATGCPYSATRFYLTRARAGQTGWPLDVITTDLTVPGVEKALREGPYGRCVYACDNDVVDHQVVAMEFDGPVSATFTMTAFTDGMGRETDIFGSHGQLRGDGNLVRVCDFRTGKSETHDANKLAQDITGGHGGGDAGIMRDFLAAVRRRDPALMASGPDVSLASHLMVFAAERARLNGTVETIRD